MVAVTPLVGLAAKAKIDPEGFQDTLLDALPGPIARAIIAQFLSQPSAGPAPPPPSSSPAPPPSRPPPTPEPRAEVQGGAPMALPASLAAPPSDALLADAKAAAEQQWAHIQAAAAAALAATRADRAAETEARRQVEEELRKEIGLLEKERQLLEQEIATLLASADGGGGAHKEQPQVVFQEVVAAGQEWRDKLDVAMAESVAAKVAAALKALPEAPISAVAARVDAGEPALASADVPLEVVQKRIKEVLQEIEARTKLENIRLRDAVQQTREAVKAELAEAKEKELAAHQRKLKQHMDEQIEAVKQAAAASIKKRQGQYADYLRALFDEASQRAQEYAETNARLAAAGEALQRESALEDARRELASAYALQANQRIEEAEDLNLRVGVLGKVLEDGARVVNHSRELQHLSVAVDAAIEQVRRDESFAADMGVIASSSDPVAQSVVRALGPRLGKLEAEPLPSKDALVDEFERSVSAARRALLVPAGSGVAGQLYASVRALGLRTLSDTELPEATTDESRLRRARVLLLRGDVGAAVDELAGLPAGAVQALQGFTAKANDRLVVEQSLRMLRAHLLTSLVSLC